LTYQKAFLNKAEKNTKQSTNQQDNLESIT